MDSRPNLYGMDREALSAFLDRYRVPPYHADQLYAWLYARGRFDPRGWTDLPQVLRDRIAHDAVTNPGRLVERAEAADGTVKYRIQLGPGDAVESVYMVQADRITLCVSSQIGCALACDFCLTGRMGLVRQLTPGEIVGQVELICADKQLRDERFNVVFMGMGEPLHNYEAVLQAYRLLVDRRGFGLSRRRITISTSGLVPQIERLATEKPRPLLAVSLNATTDELRDRIMPINRRYPLARLLEACRAYADASSEALTLEYVLLAGVNDSDPDVRRLAKIMQSLDAKLNLIPFNPVPEWLNYRPPGTERIAAIRDRLLDSGIRVSIRWSRGAEARAACGQLALLHGPEQREKRP